MKTILFATDFSVPATNAGNYATELANYFNAKLILINASGLPLTGYDTAPSLDMLGQIENASVEMLRSIRLGILQKYPHMDVECLNRVGPVVNVIDDAVKSNAVDAIVMGIIGKAGLIKEHIIGSTSLDVAHDIDVPLFIIPEGVEYKPVQKISFTCNITTLEGSAIIEEVRHFCELFKAKLETVSVEHSENDTEPPKVQPYAFLEGQFKSLKHETIVLSDVKAGATLEDYFMHHNTDLIMINPRKYSLLKSIFRRSTTKKLAFHIKTPILVIH